MATVSLVLTARDLPSAELQGMRRDGELYRVADGWCPIDELETPAHRAVAVLGIRSPRLIAELGTAAWIWGASGALPSTIEFCVGLGARARVRGDPAVRVRELVLDPVDRVTVGGAAATSPVRTAVDLARFRPHLDADDRMTLRELARIGGFTLDDCRELLERRRNLPGKRAALAVLQQVLGVAQPALTR